MKLGIVGAYPPPYGGRTIHIQRLVDFISENRRTWKILMYDLTKNGQRKDLLRLLFAADIIHYHGSDWRLRALVGFLTFFGKRVVVSIHSNVSLERQYQKASFLRRMLMRLALQKTSLIIATHRDIQQSLKALGICENLVVIPSFVAPARKKQDYAAVPQYVWNFIRSHNPTIAGNAYRLVVRDGVDVYGLDLLVELVEHLRDEYPELGLVFLLPQIGDFAYLEKIREVIHNKGLEDHILIVNEPIQAYPIWGSVQVFVRPTTTDTTAISLHEALWMGTPAIASDCVSRPEGTLIFENRDLSSLVKKTRFLLQHYETEKKRVMKTAHQNYAGEIVRIYELLVGWKDEEEDMIQWLIENLPEELD